MDAVSVGLEIILCAMPIHVRLKRGAIGLVQIVVPIALVAGRAVGPMTGMPPATSGNNLCSPPSVAPAGT